MSCHLLSRSWPSAVMAPLRSRELGGRGPCRRRVAGYRRVGSRLNETIGEIVSRALAQLVAALMAATNGIAWVLASRWERPGRHAELRASLQAPSFVGRGGDLTQVFPLLYPVLVVVAPGWTYEGWFNWSSGIDVTLQVVGLGLWGLGMALGIWAARVMGGYIAVSGLTVDHGLVTDGPYRHVRHPVYASLIAVGVGTALAFRSYLLVGVAAAYLGFSLWWVVAEEKLLGSTEGFGDAYRAYASRTGRFFPKLVRLSRLRGPV